MDINMCFEMLVLSYQTMQHHTLRDSNHQKIIDPHTCNLSNVLSSWPV
jgi:hypothetical protein